MALVLKPGTSWWKTYGRCVSVAPEAFDSDRLRNLTRGEWRRVGMPGDHVTPIDGSPIPGPPRENYDEAEAAVVHATVEHVEWVKVDIDELLARADVAVAVMPAH